MEQMLYLNLAETKILIVYWNFNSFLFILVQSLSSQTSSFEFCFSALPKHSSLKDTSPALCNKQKQQIKGHTKQPFDVNIKGNLKALN